MRTASLPVLACLIGTLALPPQPASGSESECLSLSEWQLVTAAYGGPATTYDQLQAMAGPPSYVTGITYYQDGTQEFDASFTQCDPNGVPSPGDNATFYMDNDYGTSGDTQLTGPFKVRYKASFGPVDVVITSAVAAHSAKYCSRSEFQAVKRGMTLKRVAQILDGKGKRSARIGDVEYRTYGNTTASNAQYCEVVFRSGRVIDKEHDD